LNGGDTLDARLDYLTTRALARRFDLKERAIAKATYKDFMKHYDSNPADAAKLGRVGESESNPNADPTELAAMTMLANQVLNLDEVLNK
jgi:hypothetical protein